MSSFMQAQSFSPSKRLNVRKRLPQVPHLITHSTKPKPTPPGQHKFVVQNSQQNLLQVTGAHMNENRTSQAMPPLPDIGGPTKNSMPNNVNSNSANHGQTGGFDQEMDNFLLESMNTTLQVSIENFMQRHFQAKGASVWVAIPELQLLYSQTHNAVTSQSQGLVGHSFFTRNIIRVASPTSHPAFYSPVDSLTCGSDTPTLVFPIWDWKSHLWAVIQVVRGSGEEEFSQSDEVFVDWFTNKFKLLSKWMKTDLPLESFAADILNLLSSEEFLAQAGPKICSLFDCSSVEIWKHNKSDSGHVTRYTNKAETIDIAKAGIAGDAISREATVNCSNVQIHSNYNADIDGRNPSPALALPVLAPDDNVVYAMVLRGPKHAKLFTKADESNLKRAAPLILLGLSNSESFSQFEDDLRDSKSEREGLAALLEVVEVISSQLNADKLVELIMEKGRSLTNSDRCSLFLVNENRDRLKTSLHKGLAEAIDIPIEKGIAGKTVLEGKILNIPDAYDSQYFDSTVDLSSGYRTRSILSVPIYNNRAEIIGVTEMVNKNDNLPFSAWDEKLIQIFNVFCGISLENSRLFNESTEMNNQLRSFFDTAFAMAKSESLQRIFSDIMQNAKQSIGADRATIFLKEDGKDELSTFVADGDKVPNTIPISSGVAGKVATTKTAMFVNDAYSHPAFNRAIDNVTGYTTKSLLASPILSSSGDLIGVVEMLNKQKGDFEKRDLQIINAFATFCSIALEKNRLKDIASLGDADIEMKKWITEPEMKSFEVPEQLKLTPDQVEQVSRLNCFAVDFKGIGHFKELFYIFDYFKLREKFKISSECFFRFIFTISATYNDVPYHNWTHACDVSQYVFYEVTTAKLQDRFTIYELYGLLVSAVCHDANHQGFNNVFNVKAETPLGILFKDQSVMEMHHIEQSIPIIARDDINLFQSLDLEETKKMWNQFVKLILSTDMAHHFELVKKATALVDENKWDWEDNDIRILGMQLILKVADISNVSRPFDFADKWCDILCNEFFRQGDLEKSTGIGLTSPLNDRENTDKPKSQIGFYNFICLPLYQITGRVYPELQVNADSVKSNLEKWKELAAAAAPPPAT